MAKPISFNEEQHTMLQERTLELLNSCKNYNYNSMSQNLTTLTPLYLTNPTIYTYQLLQTILHASEYWNCDEQSIQHKLTFTLSVLKHKRDSDTVHFIQSKFSRGASSLTVMQFFCFSL